MKQLQFKGGIHMGYVSIIIFITFIIMIIATWINTKIILDEIQDIKKHLGILAEKSRVIDNIVSENKNK
jgi:hypothetical protein